MTITKIITSSPAVLTHTLEVFPISAKVLAFKLTRKVAFDTEKLPKTFEAAFPSNVIQGFAHPESIAAYQADTSSVIEDLRDMHLVDAAFLKTARAQGLSAAERVEDSPFFNQAKVFDALVEDKARIEYVVRIDTSSDMLFDLDGEVLPTAVYFEYIQGQISEGSYDLPELIKFLSKNKQVTPIKPAGSKWMVTSIPGYNQSRGKTQTVSFIFSPTVEQMRQMWVKMRKINKKYPSTVAHQAIFELDLLGLRAAGIAKHETFHPPYVEPEEDTSSFDEADDESARGDRR